MLRKILIAVGLAVLTVLAIGLCLSQHYEITRSITIHADVARIHALTSDLVRWPAWVPWEQGDKSLRTSFGALTSGVGASQSWTSKSGEGRLTLTQSDPAQGVAYDLVFVENGHESPGHGAITYSPAGDGVRVTWTLSGEMDMPVLGGWFARLADRMMGPAFEQGLMALKQKAESA